jgi:hypothetical protein
MAAASNDFQAGGFPADEDPTVEATRRGATAESKLRGSRRELRHLFLDPEGDHSSRNFPRSKVMRLLTGSRGAALLVIGAGGLFLLRPKLLTSVVRVLPLSALLRMAAVRFMNRGG